MSNPAYLFLTDENGSPMVGPCLVSGREGVNRHGFNRHLRVI